MRQIRELLIPAFQPVCRLTAGSVGEVVHYEALARLRGAPDGHGHRDLLKLAEEHAFIHLLDLTMLELSIEHAVGEGKAVAVNLSVVTIERGMMEVVKTLRRFAQHCEGLILEITETMPISDHGKIEHFIRLAREIGCRIAVDDFGQNTGYFSPSVTMKLRPDYLKLDGSMLAAAVESGSCDDIRRVCGFAKAIGASVIGEVVDTEEKLDILVDCGVQYGQGWLFGKAICGQFHGVSALVVSRTNAANEDARQVAGGQR